MSLISLKSVSYQYPLENTNVIENLSLELEAGKVYGLIGANGSGKTTLCNIIRGFIPELYKGKLTGEVTLNNKKIADYNIGELSKYIGYSFQNPFTQISGVKETVYEEIAYGMENLGISRDEMKKKVSELISMFDLEELKDKNPFELSGGQKQRVALASIIALDPEVVILDEPTSQLDPQSTEDVFEIIAYLKKLGKTILLVEHKVDLIAEYCDEVILMNDGKIVLKGTTNEVLSDPKVLDYKGQLPQVALFFLRKGTSNNKIPLTVDEGFETLKGSN